MTKKEKRDTLDAGNSLQKVIVVICTSDDNDNDNDKSGRK